MMTVQTHVYSLKMQGHHYFLDAAGNGDSKERLYMTAWQGGVHRLDYVVFQDGDISRRYQIEQIDYYSSNFSIFRSHSPSIWIALLVRCPHTN